MRPGRLIVACALLAGLVWTTGSVAASLLSVEAAGTAFRVTLSDDRMLDSDQLVGAVLAIDVPPSGLQHIRIDAVAADPADPEILLHALSIENSETGIWQPFCDAGPDGVDQAFPMHGTWTPDGRHIHDSGLTLICASGAIGKCVRWGYKPWTSARGVPLWDYHQACVRMVTADYGGDGLSHTRNGTRIDVYDRLGINSPDPAGNDFAFEAAWDASGALCVHKVRIPEITTLPALASAYPRLRDRPADQCTDAEQGALLFNRS